jgi:hypothetical protein
MVNLVFLSLYFWYLEGVFDLKKTMGNLSPESSYQNQKMWMDSALITKYIDKSMVPMPIYKTTFYDLFDENFLVPLFESGELLPLLGIEPTTVQNDHLHVRLPNGRRNSNRVPAARGLLSCLAQ